ncbi:MAG: guanylate kinase [Clostridia bacterium]|nr:guanylate kinase [Clostridia bacterium]
MEKGLLIVVSGPAGSGKGTVNAMLLESEEYAFSVSATTRDPRPGEVHGKNYLYITREDFEGRIARGEMLEHTVYCDNYYGTPLKEAMEVLESGRNLILEIEVEGAMNVKRRYPDAVLIMLLPPSFAVQEARLRGRATETEDCILKRLERTKSEVALLNHYDYVVYNRDNGAGICADDIRAIVRAEKCSVRRHAKASEDYFV